MTTSIIVATSENNVIGRNNDLPWVMPEDMKFFKNTTWGMPVIMGRKTFESMKGQPLTGRTNIVITRQDDWKAEGAVVVKSINDAIFVASETDSKEAFIIGGGEIFKEAINKVDRLYRTLIHTVVDGDVFFPEIDQTKWKLTSQRDCKADEKNKFDYSFQLWERE